MFRKVYVSHGGFSRGRLAFALPLIPAFLEISLDELAFGNAGNEPGKDLSANDYIGLRFRGIGGQSQSR